MKVASSFGRAAGWALVSSRSGFSGRGSDTGVMRAAILFRGRSVAGMVLVFPAGRAYGRFSNLAAGARRSARMMVNSQRAIVAVNDHRRHSNGRPGGHQFDQDGDWVTVEVMWSP
jgi:hypothetical protein